MREPEDEGAAEGGLRFDAGTEVDQTGLVVVHRGERIGPAHGSRAVLRAPHGEAGRPVEFVFPVEIEVRGSVGGDDLERLADLVLRRLTRGMLSV